MRRYVDKWILERQKKKKAVGSSALRRPHTREETSLCLHQRSQFALPVGRQETSQDCQKAVIRGVLICHLLRDPSSIRS